MQTPINRYNCIIASNWLMQNFGTAIKAYTANTFITPALVCAIACQETAIKWLPWIKHYDAATILQRCIFDASGEPEFAHDAPRSTFPKNRIAFIQHFGSDFYKLLIAESNKTRRMQGWHDAPFLYKGYGIFQYDLQHVLADESFFSNKKWYSINECLRRLVSELQTKAIQHNELFSIVKAYNGAGTRATKYATNVMQFMAWIQTEL